jgi:hypothetical protein
MPVVLYLFLFYFHTFRVTFSLSICWMMWFFGVTKFKYFDFIMTVLPIWLLMHAQWTLSFFNFIFKLSDSFKHWIYLCCWIFIVFDGLYFLFVFEVFRFERRTLKRLVCRRKELISARSVNCPSRILLSFKLILWEGCWFLFLCVELWCFLKIFLGRESRNWVRTGIACFIFLFFLVGFKLLPAKVIQI